MFNEIKNRDAYGVVRGFVYQVDSTILRWVDLDDNEILELEKGEDIDIVTNDIENNELSRELEQIKYRESTITLNSDTSLELLYNFFQHRLENPDCKIYFRFVTNTNYGIERPALFIDGRGGIEVWIELYKLKDFDKTDKRYLIIKNFLLKKAREKFTNSN